MNTKMAVTNRKHSDDPDAVLPWQGTERVLGLQEVSTLGLRNRNFTIAQLQTLVEYGVSDLPAANSFTAGAMIYVPDGSNGQPAAAISDGTNWILFALPVYDFGMFYPGIPPATDTLQKVGIARTIQIPANMDGAIGDVGSAPTSTYDIDVRDDGNSIGTISISNSGVFTFTTVSGNPVIIVRGSIVTFQSPASLDSAISDIAVTIPALLQLD